MKIVYYTNARALYSLKPDTGEITYVGKLLETDRDEKSTVQRLGQAKIIDVQPTSSGDGAIVGPLHGSTTGSHFKIHFDELATMPEWYGNLLELLVRAVTGKANFGRPT